MTKRFLLLLFCAFGYAALSAQVEFAPINLDAETEGFSTEKIWQKGDSAYIFGDIVNVRDVATSSGAIIGQVKAGAVVVIIDKATSATINGIHAPWYKVRFQHKTEQKEGFLWGGLLAFTAFEFEDCTMLFGCTGRMQNQEEGIEYTTYEIRIEQGGSIVAQAKQNFQKSNSNDGTFAWIDNRGFTSFQGGIWIYAGGGACGVSSYQWFVFWDGIKLRPLPLLSGVGDGGVFYEYMDYIFPNQIPQGYSNSEQSKIYVKYEFFETGGELHDSADYDELESTTVSYIRALDEDEEGHFSLPKKIAERQ